MTSSFLHNRCDMAFIEPMHRNKPNITYLLSSTMHMPTLGSHYLHQRKYHCGATVEFDISFVHIEMVQEVENLLIHLSYRVSTTTVNTLEPRQNGRHFVEDIFKRMFFNENIWISIEISLKFVSQGPINNIPALVQIMAWRRPGDKPLCEPMMISLPTHICVTRPQWVNLVPQGAGVSAAIPLTYLSQYNPFLAQDIQQEGNILLYNVSSIKYRYWWFFIFHWMKSLDQMGNRCIFTSLIMIASI